MEPLFGFEWNQTEGAQELEAGLFTVVAKDLKGDFHAVGTGFVVIARDEVALAVSAGHVFAEVQRLQDDGIGRVHPSTLPEFAPPKKPVNVSLSGLAMLSRVGALVFASRVEGLAFDALSDIGVIQLRPQQGTTFPQALRQFTLEDRLPEVGDLVCIAGYADLSCKPQGLDGFQVQRKAVLRVGKVSNVFPDGQRLCRGPCFETTIPVFSGMSGSPVCYYESVGAMKVVGLVCSDPDVDGPAKNDRSAAGKSLVACLPTRRQSGSPQGVQEVMMSFAPTAVTGSFVGL